MNLEKISEILKDEPKYRFSQVFKAIFNNGIDDFNKISNLPKALREKLDSEVSLNIDGVVAGSKKEKVLKVLITLEDGLKIETVLLLHPDRTTICLSSQVGCPLNCKFCATGKNGFKRDLTSWEIVEQAVFWLRYLNTYDNNKKITNLVFMGMGEPFLNYNNVLKAVNFFNDKNYFNISSRKISISTTGLTEGIMRLAREKLSLNLAISLHAPNDNLRAELMPIARKYKIKDILKAADYYIENTGRRVMFEYLLINNFNDNEDDALALASLMNKKLYFVNLIKYNKTGELKPSEIKRIDVFQKILEKNNISVTRRYSFGDDIGGACGQLAGK